MQADLVAVLVAVTGGQPRILTTRNGLTLPAGPFTANHHSLQASLRAWVETQTHHPLGFVEQLYTFADRDRSQEVGMRAISISYLALTREPPVHPCRARLLRHAQIAPGRILLPVCEADGERTLTVTKKDPLWKRARKIRWGERV